MAYLVQADTKLYSWSDIWGVLSLQLPGDITLRGNIQPIRPALLANGEAAVIAVVNAGNHDFYITESGEAYSFNLTAPSTAPTVVAGAGAGMTGAYQVAVTYKIKDGQGRTIAESALGPPSTSVTVADKTLAITKIPLSEHVACNSRGIYRTTAGGDLFYPWFDMDGNSLTSTDRGGTDALLSLLPADQGALGSPPDFSHICAWRDRFWGIPRLRPDNLRWCEERIFYAWPERNEIVLPPQNVDSVETPAFVPRRDALGIGHNGHFFQVTGYSNDTFQRQLVDPGVGIHSQESVVVINNSGYFLGKRAGRTVVFEWNDEGLHPVSEAQVDAWFNTDTYFNRARFPYAQGRYNPDTDAYELMLADLSVDVDRGLNTDLNNWVSFSLRTRQWYGPHKTAAFTPICAGNDPTSFNGTLVDADRLPLAVFGGDDGYLYQRDASVADDNDVAVDMLVELPPLHAGTPDTEKVWLQPTIHSKIEATGALSITPSIGGVDATGSTVISHDLTLGRQRLPRLGRGRYAQLTLEQAVLGQSATVYGIELPYTLCGRR